MAHPDLVPNFFMNTGETAGNNVDDEGNGYVDDRTGWDFVPCWGGGLPGCGDNDPTGPDTKEGARHGTMTAGAAAAAGSNARGVTGRSEEHTSELQSLMRISYAVFCLKKKTYIKNILRLLALAHPVHEMRAPHNGKPSRCYKDDGQMSSCDRISEAAGAAVAQNTLRIEQEAAGMHLQELGTTQG